MTAYRAEFFTLEDVKRLKVIQDVIDQRLPIPTNLHQAFF